MPYIRKTTDISISDEIRKVLEVIKSESLVAQLLLRKRHSNNDLVDKPVDYISISSNDKNKISYMSLDRIKSVIDDEYFDYWTNTKRFHVKPGAFVGKIFKDIPAKEVEIFSNLFKSESNKVDFDLKVVDGDKIKKYYYWESYANDRGSLGVSCMKHDSCQKYFDVYSDNPDNISMLVMLDTDNLLIGRAILWDFGSHKIMDRIYTVDDEKLQLHFKKWATDNGYLYKSEQNWFNTLFFENMKTGRKELRLEIDLASKIYKYYPYLDTFKFIDCDGILYNYIPDGVEINTLSSTDGRKQESDYLRFDAIDKVYRYRGESTHVRYMDFYTHERNVVWSEINDQYILRADSFYDEELRDNIFKKELDDYNDTISINKRRSYMKERSELRSKSIKEKSVSWLDHYSTIVNSSYMGGSYMRGIRDSEYNVNLTSEQSDTEQSDIQVENTQNEQSDIQVEDVGSSDNAIEYDIECDYFIDRQSSLGNNSTSVEIDFSDLPF